ncbi:hypothetical protein GQX74_006008 [Glossina fuscipes]|nr:hypothetical protein GQX74_006008 [Glossina fuscipes]
MNNKACIILTSCINAQWRTTVALVIYRADSLYARHENKFIMKLYTIRMKTAFCFMLIWIECMYNIFTFKHCKRNDKVKAFILIADITLMHAVVFGNVTAIIQRMYSRRSLYEIRTSSREV